MNPTSNKGMTKDMETIVDLLLEQSLHGLNDEDRLQLDLLLAGIDERQRGQLATQLEAALAAAGNASALAAAAEEGRVSPPPASLIARLEADADQFFGVTAHAGEDDMPGVTRLRPGRAAPQERTDHRPAPGDADPSERGAPKAAARGWVSWSGWAVAALLLMTVWAGRPAPAPSPVAPSEARATLVAADGTVQLDWSPSAWEDFEDVRGDVIWNDERQEGYLRLVGMPSNDPQRSQYQLWIVDPERDEEPVDGGVFDIPPGMEEVVVPVRATLAVDRPVAFAITRERPGGVVVSEGPLLVVASRS